jgi:cardiolipin synthase
MAAISQGNMVELLGHGDAFFAALLDACAKAGEYIHLEFYIIRDDSTGRTFADTLIKAVNRGVKVLLIYDYIGCFDTPSSYFKRLTDGGVRCIPFNPPPFRRGIAWFDKRDHRKMVVIDGRRAFVGGVNIGDEYAGTKRSHERWRDLGMRIDGPAAADLEKLFRSNWREEKGEVPPAWRQDPAPVEAGGEAEVMIVNGGPHHNRSMIRSAFRLAIAGASDSVRIINPYFVPGPRVVRSLLRAAARGVEVQLLLPSKSDVPVVRLVSRSYYAPLLNSGIKIFELEGSVLHAKVMLIDDAWTVLGSANLDPRSFHRNYEVNAIVNSRDFGIKVKEMFERDLAGSRMIISEEHERRGFLTRLMERLFAPLSWFL